ncbi:MAG TPA: SPASM domain-containing protein, partial [Bacteroidales bacterium]
SFEKVMKGIALLKKHKIEFNTLTVVNINSSKYPLEIYHFLKEIGSIYIQFLPVVERRTEKRGANILSLISPDYKEEAYVTEWSVKPVDYGNFLITIFNEWVRNDVGRYYIQLFDVTLANWVGEHPGLCVFAETCGDALVIEHNGDVYSCDHFVYPQYILGNIKETLLKTLAMLPEQYAFGRSKLNNLPQYCIGCEYRFACHGECPKHRFAYTPDGEPGLNYLCKAYKMFFSHVHPYMQYMGDELAQQRPPANVMQWTRRINTNKVLV